MIGLKSIALLAGGFLIGTAGVKILSSKEAKKIYAHTTAAVIRAKDCVMTKATEIREGCGDILADARDINEKRCEEDLAQEITEDDSEGAEDEAPAEETDI